MPNSILSEQMFKILSNHVNDIEKEKDGIIKSFYADNAGTGMDIEAFFREYVSTVENYLNGAKIRKDAADNCPLSIIGSTVEVRDTSDMETYSFHIVLPDSKKAGRDMSHASCLSPMGKALLLKTAGSRVSINTPAGILNYEVTNITLPHHAQEDSIVYLYQKYTNASM